MSRLYARWQESKWLPAIALFCLYGYLFALLYVQFFVVPSDLVDFRAHSEITDKNYIYPSYLYILRQAVEAITGLEAYEALFVLVCFFHMINIAVPFLLFFKSAGSASVAAIAVYALFLFTPVYNILDGDVYIGQISPNVWHSSTFTISYLPNLLMFLSLVWALDKPATLKSALLVFGLAALSIGSKPSLFIVLTPALMAFCLLFRRDLILRAICLWTAPLVLFAFYYVFLLPADVKAAIQPGAVWSVYSSNKFFSILVSLLFFIVAALIYGRKLTMRLDFALAALAVFAGVAQFYLLAEPGERFYHGNLGWGMHKAAALLLFVTLRFLVTQPFTRKELIAGIALVPHILTGVAFTLNLVLGGTIFF